MWRQTPLSHQILCAHMPTHDWPILLEIATNATRLGADIARSAPVGGSTYGTRVPEIWLPMSIYTYKRR